MTDAWLMVAPGTVTGLQARIAELQAELARARPLIAAATAWADNGNPDLNLRSPADYDLYHKAHAYVRAAATGDNPVIHDSYPEWRARVAKRDLRIAELEAEAHEAWHLNAELRQDLGVFEARLAAVISLCELYAGNETLDYYLPLFRAAATGEQP